ncbi:MAG TPA: Sir2 family NAD-dependent protein deacetylase [Kofleriaceae bacterium]|nr:Sir2 family NAD-dependent protein deacetylase [Kofleriaceae bacterium]
MEPILAACRAALAHPGRVIALTGAGVSAESGIPTFRGKEGYWTIGAREYHPQELATHSAFQQMPWDVWAWYLYRRSVCRAAQPNPGHHALTRLATALPDRFALVTQNVDGLHRRAGTPSEQLFAIHGDISLMRCAAECGDGGALNRWPIPDGVPEFHKGDPVGPEVRALLVCPRCGQRARPHVLWFDESYDEPRYYFETVLQLAQRAALVIVAGTSAQTSLPWHVVQLASAARATIVDVNLEDNPFGDIAARSGGVIRGPSAAALTAIVDALISR